MSNNVKLLQSTDSGAPSLTGQAGTLKSVLQAILVDGYNPQTISSITRSGTTATATTLNTHNYIVGDCLLNAGADQTEYNGEIYVTSVPTVDTFTFEVTGTPTTPATGASITTKKAPAGWTKEFDGTNLAVFRPGAGNRFRMRIDDTGTTPSMARFLGYETMSDVNTGTGAFPTAAQFTGGLYIPKSATPDAVARGWVALVTDTYLLFWVNVDNSSTGLNGITSVFGDIQTYKSGDQYHTLIIGGTSVSNSSIFYNLTTVIQSSLNGHYIARPYTQLGSSLQVGKHSDEAKNSGSNIGSGGAMYPNGPDGALVQAPIWIHETNGSGSHIRGILPGVWCPCHNKPLSHKDIFTGSGTLAGKRFLVLNIYSSAQMFLEISNTWGNY